MKDTEPKMITSATRPGLTSTVKSTLWVVVGVIIVLYILKYGIEVSQTMWGGARAVAHVVDTSDDVVEAYDGRKSGIVTVADYEFEVNGRSFRGKTEGQQGSWSIGDVLDVEYYPSDPSKNRKTGDLDPFLNFLILAFLGGTISYFALKTSLPVLFGHMRK